MPDLEQYLKTTCRLIDNDRRRAEVATEDAGGVRRMALWSAIFGVGLIALGLVTPEISSENMDATSPISHCLVCCC